MKFEYENAVVKLSGYDSFLISEILECGQCFRFERLKEEDYRIIVFGRVLRIRQEEKQILFFGTNEKEMNALWIPYFDLQNDYNAIKTVLAEKDAVLKQAVEFAPGIRILNQDFFECLISFILSQNNRISKIKTAMKNISEKYGELIGEENGEKLYSFPSARALETATEEELKSCKTGFRARYIMDAVKKVNEAQIDGEALKKMATEEARQKLMEIKGVGPKVADCVLLFSLGRREVFPTDVWIKKIMSHFYFDGNETSLKEIHERANLNFGEYGGFAQQYLFHYARMVKIG